MSSRPGTGDTYGLGETIRVGVTFSEAVAGSPRLEIDMDPADWGEKWAVYESGGGTDSLNFAYEVVEPNESTQGVRVGVRVADGEATGPIEHTDLMPAALLARFGRATAEQVVTHIEERMAAPRRRGLRARFAGREFQPGSSERGFALGFLSQFAQPMGAGPVGAAPMGGAAVDGAAPMAMGTHAAGLPGAGMPGQSGAMGMTAGVGGMTGTGAMGSLTGVMGTTGQHSPMGGAATMAGYGSGRRLRVRLDGAARWLVLQLGSSS